MNHNGPLTGKSENVAGTEFLSALYAAIKALQIYPDENQVVKDAITQLERLAFDLIKREGGLAVWLAGSFIFVNDLRVRVDLTDYATLAALRELLRGHGIGRLTVSSEVTRRDWLGFLGLAGAPSTPGSGALGTFETRLAEIGVTVIKVAAPAPLFNPQGEDDAIEAARRTYAISVKAARDMMSTMLTGKAIGARRTERAILGLVDQVLQDPASILGMVTLRDFDDHSYIHSVNVAILSLALGDHLGFSREQLFQLGFAGLFHDIGKILIAPDVLNKKGWLNEEEWDKVSQHPDFGLLMLFNVEGFQEPPYRAMLAAYEHHMKPDLSGYPRVIRRRRQGLFGRIIAVTEAYDAAISPFSKQFAPSSPDEVIRQLREAENNQFDPIVVKAFANMMGLYPVGTTVILDTGELAVVVAKNPAARALSRPLVRLVAEADGTRIANGPIRDLTEADPSTGKVSRTISRSTDPARYSINISDYVA
ncbi:MAG: HD domain-containing phosphohydrolase [Gemmatimonadota bacterium]